MDKESNKRRSTENLLTGWMGGDKKRKTNEPSSPLSTSAIATETETITRSMEKVQISPAKSSPNVDKVRAKLDFSATLPPSASPYWSIVKQHSKKACLAEMRRAGLDEMAEWNTKAFLDKNPPGYTYLWFKKSDWEAINALDTIEAKIEMMFATVLYVGIDADFDRFPGHLSPYHFATPFDRFLKTALANGEKFVAVYFGTKNKMNLAFECVMIAKVKWAKLQFFKVHQSATKLFNIHQSSPDKFVTGFNSNQFISVLVCLFEMALKSPVRIFESKEHHQQKVKDYFAKMQILQNNRFELFIEELMNSLVKANGQLKCDKLLGFTDTEFECFLGKMLKCKIVKQEKNGKLVPYITVSTEKYLGYIQLENVQSN